jgi:hypothetical protein
MNNFPMWAEICNMKVTTNMHLVNDLVFFFCREMSDFQILESLFSLTQNNATGRNASNNFLKELCFEIMAGSTN